MLTAHVFNPTIILLSCLDHHWRILGHYNWLNQGFSLRLDLTLGLNSIIDFSVAKGRNFKENIMLLGKLNIHWAKASKAALEWSSNGFGTFWEKDH